MNKETTRTTTDDLLAALYAPYLAESIMNHQWMPLGPPPTRWERFKWAVKRAALWPWRTAQRALRWVGGCRCDED